MFKCKDIDIIPSARYLICDSRTRSCSQITLDPAPRGLEPPLIHALIGAPRPESVLTCATNVHILIPYLFKTVIYKTSHVLTGFKISEIITTIICRLTRISYIFEESNTIFIVKYNVHWGRTTQTKPKLIKIFYIFN